jgi:hypothetical protein
MASSTAADYIVWRNSIDQPAADLRADADLDDDIDSADYGIWRRHFGQSVAIGIGESIPLSPNAVPEPSTVALAMFIGTFLLCGRSTRSTGSFA